jgi:uncharacterized protein (DUF2235 family)
MINIISIDDTTHISYRYEKKYHFADLFDSVTAAGDDPHRTGKEDEYGRL